MFGGHRGHLTTSGTSITPRDTASINLSDIIFKDEAELGAEDIPIGWVDDDDEDVPLTVRKHKATSRWTGTENDFDKEMLLTGLDCCVLLLEARKILINKQVEVAPPAPIPRKPKIQDLQSQLASGPPINEDEDLSKRIQELKQQLVIQVRTNHTKDKQLAELEKKIALLIKNKGADTDSKKKAVGNVVKTKDLTDSKKITQYGSLFYLLQTEPRYLANLVYLVNAEQMDSFLETTILTLYGDACTPREEYLLLKVFQIATKKELSSAKTVNDFIGGADSVVPKMIITYNRRKPGKDYLKKTLAPFIQEMISKSEDLNLELNVKNIYQSMISEEELKTGQKSTLDRNVSYEQAKENETVQKMLAERITACEAICQKIIDAILDSLRELPYGIRWISKLLKDIAKTTFPDISYEDILKLEVYFVYYRFMNLAIVTPDQYGCCEKDFIIPSGARKNLVIIAKILQNVFNFKDFNENEKAMMPLNPFVLKQKPALTRYFEDLIRVPEPEDFLQVSKYMEMTSKNKPVIFISLHELFNTHAVIAKHLDGLAPDKEDPLRKVLQELGPPPPDMAEYVDKDIQLTLQSSNRFHLEEEEENVLQRLYTETKELVIPLLATIPVIHSLEQLTLDEILNSGKKYATDNNKPEMLTQIDRVLENLQKLEKEEMVTKEDDYQSFIDDLAIEVANRSAIREQQKKEIARLEKTLEELRGYENEANTQIGEFKEYVNAARDKQYKAETGPFTFKYKELAEKRKVIVNSDVPELVRKKTKFTIASTGNGLFSIVATVAGAKSDPIELSLDQLLEMHEEHKTELVLDHVTLDVNMTLHLLNEKFRQTKKKGFFG